MTQIATVEKDLGGGYAEVSVPRKSACGHDCEECAGCGVSGASVGGGGGGRPPPPPPPAPAAPAPRAGGGRPG